MIALPFVVMLAAVCLGVAMCGTYRNLTGQQPHPRKRGHHTRPRRGSFGRSVFGGGEWRSFTYHTVAKAPGGADERTHMSAPSGLRSAAAR